MTLEAVFFDLDGTLLDTSHDLGYTLNLLLERHHRPTLSQIEIRPHVSNGANALIKLGFGDPLSEEQRSGLRTEFLDIYLKNIARHSHPFDGIVDLLEQLSEHNILWGIVTNKPGLYTRALMSEIRLPSSPAAVVSPDDVGVAKPDPKPLLKACEIAGCNPTSTIYVGDHHRDIECGMRAQMDTIAVGYGFTQEATEHLHWGATHTVDSANQIWPLIKSHYLAST